MATEDRAHELVSVTFFYIQYRLPYAVSLGVKTAVSRTSLAIGRLLRPFSSPLAALGWRWWIVLMARPNLIYDYD